MQNIREDILKHYSAFAADYYIKTLDVEGQSRMMSIIDLQKRMKKSGWGKKPEDFGVAFGDVAKCLSGLVFASALYTACAEDQRIAREKNSVTTLDALDFRPIDKTVRSPFHGKTFSFTKGELRLSENMQLLFDAVRKRAGMWDDQYYMVLWDNLIIFEKMLEKAFAEKHGEKQNTSYVRAFLSLAMLNEAFFIPDENSHFYHEYEKDDSLKAYDTDTFGPELSTISSMLEKWQKLLTGKSYIVDDKKDRINIKRSTKTLFALPEPDLFLLNFADWKTKYSLDMLKS